MNDTIEPAANVERPKEVTRAIQAISASFAIGGVRAIFDLAQKVSGASFFIALLILLLFLGIFLFFLSRVGKGKNWARITLLALLLVGLPLAIPGYILELRTNLPRGCLSVLIAILQVIGMYLLFTKNSNLWFRRRQ